MNKYILKMLSMGIALAGSGQAMESQNSQQKLADELGMPLKYYLIMMAEHEIAEYQRQGKVKFEPEDQKSDPKTLVDFMGTFSQNTGDRLFPGDNLFLAPHQGILGFDYIEGDYILERENSSAKDNCCLLFSLIRNDRDLLQKIMGPYYDVDYIMNNPELANVCEEDARDMGLRRRSLKEVREKFFQDIKTRLDDTFFTSNGNEITLRNFLKNKISRTNRTISDLGIQDISLILDLIHESNWFLEDYFSTVFSWLYDVPVMLFVKNGDKLENGMLPNTMPYFTKEDVKEARLIYHNGVHYQKLHKLATLN